MLTAKNRGFVPELTLDLAAFEFLSQLLNRKPLKPLMAVPRVVASASPVHAQKPCETVHPQFAMENTQGVCSNCSSVICSKGIIAPSPVSSLQDSIPVPSGFPSVVQPAG